LLTLSEHKIPQWPCLVSLSKPSDLSADEGLQFFQEQMDNCHANHTKCRNDDEPTLPKRVLDVGAEEQDGIKLYEPNGNHGKYAALSHRWCEPGTPMFTTTKATLSQHLESIGWDDLPKTLQDAIKVSRKLNICYLWVDTLCIIQDGDGDDGIETELPKMATYYADAFCTIAAASSKNSTESFLQVRDECYQPVEFEFGREQSTIHVRRFGVVGTLANRGWTWQESALSRRILNFSPSELIWECKSELKSECGYELRFTPSLGLPQRFDDAAKHPLDRWRQVVQSYSARELTHDEDILPAISGLAQKTNDAAKSQYLAGLWRADLPWGLLWEVIRGPSEPLPVLPEQYTAPSWSWASIKGQVRTCDKPFGTPVKARGSFDIASVGIYPVVQVFAAECNLLARQNPFGKVTEGFITLNGFPIWCILTCDHDMTSGWTFRVQSPTGHVVPILPDTVIEEFDLRPPPARIPARTVRRAKSGRQKKIFRAPVLCLPVAMLSGPEPSCIRYAGIVLAPSEICQDAFTRIGVFRFRKEFFEGFFYYTVKIV
jgi:Heterokaryon incompatibility protein (HET)